MGATDSGGHPIARARYRIGSYREMLRMARALRQAAAAATTPHDAVVATFGVTLFLLAGASADGARVLSVDVRGYDRPRGPLFRLFGRHGQSVGLHQGDSHSAETREAVERYFPGRPLLLFIDGDHAYDAVWKDYELYASLVRPGGTIAFHDIVDGPEASVGGVPQVWCEIRSDLRDVKEIVHSRDQGGHRIEVGVRAR